VRKPSDIASVPGCIVPKQLNNAVRTTCVVTRTPCVLARTLSLTEILSVIAARQSVIAAISSIPFMLFAQRPARLRIVYTAVCVDVMQLFDASEVSYRVEYKLGNSTPPIINERLDRK
jgi:hypothetical protein